MKKKLIAMVLVISALFSLNAAADVDLSFGANLNALELGIKADNSGTNFSGAISISVQSDIFIENGHGLYVGLGYASAENKTTLGAGYAYTTKCGNLDFIFNAGPRLVLGGSIATLGLDCDFNFQTYFSGVDGLFLRFGAGIDMDFVDFGQKTEGYFHMNLILPQFAIGYKF